MASNIPDLNLLRIAFAVYDELSVSRAARVLGMSQPAVSMALRRLREAFNDPLFIRVSGGIAPTPRAHAIVQLARPLMQRLQDDLLKGETFAPATSTRPFRLALSDVGEMAFLQLIMKSLRDEAPNCAIHTVALPTDQVAHEMEKGEIDLAIGYLPALALKNFRQLRIDRQRFACLLRTGHPLRSGRLTAAQFSSAEHIVVRGEGRSQSVVERFFERRRIRRRVIILTPHFLSVPFIVSQSNLIATVPHSVASTFAAMIPDLAVAKLPFEVSGFDLKMHWHRRFDNEPRNRWLREQIATAFRTNRSDLVPRRRVYSVSE